MSIFLYISLALFSSESIKSFFILLIHINSLINKLNLSIKCFCSNKGIRYFLVLLTPKKEINNIIPLLI